jgi:acyl-CoA thioester hydrolase
MAHPGPPPTPFDGYRDLVRPEWIDENQHMNMGYYVVVFDHATDAWLDHVGLTAEHKEAHGVSTFTLESHVLYLRELREGDPLRFTTRLLDYDEKRIHYLHEMHHGTGHFLASTNELMSLHVSRGARRATPMAEAVLERLAELAEAHGRLPPPPQAGRHIGLAAGRAARSSA